MPDGSGLVQLSQDTVEESEPIVSPDGRLIAFRRQSHVIVRDVAGGGETELTGLLHGYGLRWSPDSEWLAALWGCCGARRFPLRVIRADGSGAHDLANGCNLGFGATISGYTWSPDATRLAYSDATMGGCLGASLDLSTIGRDGAAGVPVAADPSIGESYPAWSPGGEWIAFNVFRNCLGGSCVGGLEMVRPDGTARTPLSSVIPRGGYYPVWSPDGARIAFGSDSPAGLQVVDVGSGEVRDLSPYQVGGFAWSPDGARLAFGSDAPAGLYVVDVGSGELRNLFPHGVTGVAWSPDGTQLAFASGESGAHDIYVINGDGTNPIPVGAAASADDYGPVWVPGS